MEVLQPRVEEPKSDPIEAGPESSNFPFTPKEIDAIRYLGVQDSIFNEGVIARVKELSEYFPDLEMIDLKLGNPMGVSRLDKMYSYMKLCKQSDDIRRRELLIEEAKSKLINNQNVSL